MQQPGSRFADRNPKEIISLDCINPDALIARANIERSIHPSDHDVLAVEGEYRYTSSYAIDGWYLGQLSPDATPTLIELLPSMTPEDQVLVREHIKEQRQQLEQIAAEDGWPSWHYSRAMAIRE